MLIGLQIHRVKEILRIYDADTAKIKNDFFKMQVSPTHSSTVQSFTKALMSCPYCCPIFTSLYRMSCIEIATIGIKLQAAAWVRDLNYPVVPTSVHPTVNKLNVPVILSLEIASVQYGTTAIWTMFHRKAYVDVNVCTLACEFVLLLIQFSPTERNGGKIKGC